MIFVWNSCGNNGNYRHKWIVFALIIGHNGRCDTLWTHPPLNGVQEVGGFRLDFTPFNKSARPDTYT